MKILIFHFWPEKLAKIWSSVYQKMRNSNIWEGTVAKQGSICLYFHEKIMILDY
jgi:hypothetical protein